METRYNENAPKVILEDKFFSYEDTVILAKHGALIENGNFRLAKVVQPGILNSGFENLPIVECYIDGIKLAIVDYENSIHTAMPKLYKDMQVQVYRRSNDAAILCGIA